MMKLSIGVSFFLYLVCGLFLYATVNLKNQETKIMPFAVISITAILSTVLLIRTVRDKTPAHYDLKKILPVILISGLLVFYFILLKYIGFYFATPIFLVLSMLSLGQKNKKTILLVTVITVISIFLVFDILFKMYLPAGEFTKYLF